MPIHAVDVPCAVAHVDDARGENVVVRWGKDVFFDDGTMRHSVWVNCKTSGHLEAEKTAWSYFKTRFWDAAMSTESHPDDLCFGCGPLASDGFHGDPAWSNMFWQYPEFKSLSTLGVASWNPRFEFFLDPSLCCTNHQYIKACLNGVKQFMCKGYIGNTRIGVRMRTKGPLPFKTTPSTSAPTEAIGEASGSASASCSCAVPVLAPVETPVEVDQGEARRVVELTEAAVCPNGDVGDLLPHCFERLLIGHSYVKDPELAPVYFACLLYEAGGSECSVRRKAQLYISKRRSKQKVDTVMRQTHDSFEAHRGILYRRVYCPVDMELQTRIV